MIKINTRVQVVLITILGIVLFFGGIKYQEYRLAGIVIETEIKKEDAEENNKEEVEKIKYLMVHVVGAVEHPGVYEMEEGKRIGDVINKAVPTKEADLAAINLAEVLKDGVQVYLPKKGEVPKKPISSFNSPNVGKININSASAKELESLSGIGPVLAGRIVDYRNKNGPFSEVEELTKVSGIGPAVLKKINNKVIAR